MNRPGWVKSRSEIPFRFIFGEIRSNKCRKIAIDKVYKFYRLTGETEVDMSYIQNAQTDSSGQRLANAQTFRPAYAGAFAYLVFALAFVFTGAVVLGLIP
jgi:hypothetical protein